MNFNPNTHAAAPNSYAFAGGTSLAVPFVSAEAVLIEAQFPGISNAAVRDRIVRSADSIDALNPTQCNGSSCAGLLGSGRINAFAALSPSLVPTIPDGSLVDSGTSTPVYLVTGGMKELVSSFVLGQRFFGQTPLVVPAFELSEIPAGTYAMPKDGTFVKSADSSIVYETGSGSKHPVTYQVFVQRAVAENQVSVVGDTELASWITTTFFPPTDGTLVRGAVSPTVYWVVNGLLHPVNAAFYAQRGLQIFPLMVVPDADVPSFAQGNSYVL